MFKIEASQRSRGGRACRDDAYIIVFPAHESLDLSRCHPHSMGIDGSGKGFEEGNGEYHLLSRTGFTRDHAVRVESPCWMAVSRKYYFNVSREQELKLQNLCVVGCAVLSLPSSAFCLAAYFILPFLQLRLSLGGNCPGILGLRGGSFGFNDELQ